MQASSPPVPVLSTELALRAFEADQQFSAALAALQATFTQALSPVEAARKANAHGFSWLSRPSDDDASQIEVHLRHQGGAEAIAVGHDISQLLGGLLGLNLLAAGQTSEPEQGAVDNSTALEGRALQPALQPELEPTGAADNALDEDQPPALLDEQQKASAVSMIKAMTPEQRKAFTIAFRDAFRVDREERSITPLITEQRHLTFIDRFTVEAAGGISE